MELTEEFEELISNAIILSSFAKIMLDYLESQDFDVVMFPDLISLAMVIKKLANEQNYKIADIKNQICDD